MKLTVLGSGTYQPRLDRHSSGYLVKVKKQNLIFDFGRGILDNLLKLDIHYYDIDTIFISHHHADHCSELASFFHVALSLGKKDLVIYGPKGISRTINHIIKSFHFQNFQPKRKVKVKELGGGGVVKNKDWTVKSYLAKHSPSRMCLCYRLESGNKILSYSGDTKDCPGLRKACQNADLAVIETSWPEKIHPKMHMSGVSTGKAASESGVKKLVCTHISPYYLEKFSVRDEVRKFYKGPLVIAKDLMEIKI